jgi:hypothetical protein
MKQEINLEEIFDKMCEEMPWSFIGKEQIKPYTLEAIKLVCFKCLDLAAENAEINWIENNIKMESDSDFSFRDSDGNWCKISIKEDSILQIKDWIK